MINAGKVYLIPTIIAEGTVDEVIPSYVKTILKSINNFLVEDVRTARRYLSSLKIYEDIQLLRFDVLDKDTSPEKLPDLFNPLKEGKNLGIISESGCPGIADPGAIAVGYAHRNNITVVPLVGPSSILLALIGSGLNGQRFAFHGYLPINADEAVAAIRNLENESRKKDQTQIFIETPYRNNAMFSLLIRRENIALFL